MRTDLRAKRIDSRRNAGQNKPSGKRKMSEMIWAFAGDFIRAGDSSEQRQKRMIGACSAWNMACTPAVMEKGLDSFVTEYRRYKPSVSDADLHAIRKDMATLIHRKLQMFPGDSRRIISARLVQGNCLDRIEAMSVTLH